MAEPIKASKEDIEAGLKLLQKKREYEEKVKRGEVKGAKKWSEMSEPEKAKAREQGRKYTARLKAIGQLKDAALEKAGIKITEDQIQAKMKQLMGASAPKK